MRVFAAMIAVAAFAGFVWIAYGIGRDLRSGSLVDPTTALVNHWSRVGSPAIASCGRPWYMQRKPLIPLGCQDMIPVCECDPKDRQYGEPDCMWRWECVPTIDP